MDITGRVEPRSARRRRRQAEEDAAWALHLATEVQLEVRVRRKWLADHLVRQKGRCVYCSTIMAIDAENAARGSRATIDHVVPRSAGGADTKENTVAACAFCNTSKGSLPVADWLVHPARLARLKKMSRPPDRLGNDPLGPYFDQDLLDRGIGIIFNGKERREVHEYCVSEGWIRVRFGKSYDRTGHPITRKIFGSVEPYFEDVACLTAILTEMSGGLIE